MLGDHTECGLFPEGWTSKVVTRARAWGADSVVVEKNGGEMATSGLKTADRALPVRPVHAQYGKGDRAEPVAMLFETGRARLAGIFPDLEDGIVRDGPGRRLGRAGRSPDRTDAMVWAMTELMPAPGRAEPRVRQL